ncbi:MAG: hypothetical protein AB1585_11720 [Thermodesulfobacteriota bacterium]
MKLTKKLLTLTTGILLLSGSYGTALAEEKKEEPKPYATGSTFFGNKYVWRGYELSKDSLVIQPSLTVGYTGIEVGLWGNLDTKDHYLKTDKANWNETDLTLSYTKEAGPTKLTGGAIYYSLDSADDSLELFFRAAGNFLLSPTISIYREILNYPGWYVNLGAAHSFNLTKTVTLDMAASIGYQISDTDKIVKYDSALMPTAEKYRALHDGLISVGMTIPFGKYFALKPMVGYSLALSDDAKRRIKGTGLSGKENFFLGGVSLTGNF